MSGLNDHLPEATSLWQMFLDHGPECHARIETDSSWDIALWSQNCWRPSRCQLSAFDGMPGCWFLHHLEKRSWPDEWCCKSSHYAFLGKWPYFGMTQIPQWCTEWDLHWSMGPGAPCTEHVASGGKSLKVASRCMSLVMAVAGLFWMHILGIWDEFQHER